MCKLQRTMKLTHTTACFLVARMKIEIEKVLNLCSYMCMYVCVCFFVKGLKRRVLMFIYQNMYSVTSSDAQQPFAEPQFLAFSFLKLSNQQALRDFTFLTGKMMSSHWIWTHYEFERICWSERFFFLHPCVFACLCVCVGVLQGSLRWRWSMMRVTTLLSEHLVLSQTRWLTS